MMAGDVCDTLRGCEGIHREGGDLFAALARGDVVIVGVDLNRPIERIEGRSNFLSETEQSRAKEYVRDLDRIRFIRRRITLRRLLGDLLGRDPRSNVIRTDPFGKPFVDGDSSLGPLSFSMSHSRDRAIFAFAKERQVGIDIEYREPSIDVLKMASVVCTPAERARLEASPIQDQSRAFFDCWCAKEAYLKAAGVREPRSFEVSFWPNEPRLVWDRSMPDDSRRWSFHRFTMGADWAAMLVVERGSGGFGLVEIDESRVLAL
jgi:4'-phosphopantetheinyl transferase